MDEIIEIKHDLEKRDFNSEEKIAKLKIKKLQLSLKVLKQKFLEQIKLIKLSSKDKISQVLLRNCLLIHSIFFRVKQLQDGILEDIDEIKKCESEVLKISKSSDLNEKQIKSYFLLNHLSGLFDSNSIFEFDYEILSLSDDVRNRSLKSIPEVYHENMLYELDQIKPIIDKKETVEEFTNNIRVIEKFDPLSEIIDALKTAADEIIKSINVVGDFIDNMIKEISNIFDKIFDTLGDIFKKIKEIVMFIGGKLLECIEVFFKILKFLFLLITQWVPYFFKKTVSYFTEFWSRKEIFLFTLLLKVFLDILISIFASDLSSQAERIISIINLSEFTSFYLFWLFPKTVKIWKDNTYNFIKDFVIFLAYEFGSLGDEILHLSESIYRFRFFPKWIISWYIDIPPKLDLNINDFTKKDINAVTRLEKFVDWLGENGGVLIIKSFYLYLLVHILIYFFKPALDYGMITLKEISIVPVVAFVDTLHIIFRRKFPKSLN